MYKKIFVIIFIILAIGIVFYLNNKEENNISNTNDSNVIITNTNISNVVSVEERQIDMIKLMVNDNILDIKLENNSSSNAFIEELKKGEIVINAEDYGDFEKVGDLGFNLPTNDERVTTEAGDLILYQGNKITLYYDTNTWNFTKLGKVQNVSKEDLKQILGKGNVELKFYLDNEV